MLRRFVYGFVFLLLCGVVLGGTGTNVTTAQDEPQIQALFSAVSADNYWVYFDLYGMKAGQTIYLYAESDQFDTALDICDIDCEENFATADDIEEGVNTNTALEYTFEADGDYSIVVYDCCDQTAEGIFRLLIGFNAPEVLTGNASPNGATIAIPYEPTFTNVEELLASEGVGGAQVQEISDSVAPDREFVYYDLFGITAGQTIYLYAESAEIDTRVIICDITCEEILGDADDISDSNTNSSLEYTFTADGDYSIAVTDCCQADITGGFRLLIGYNAPEVLDGSAMPNGAEIAVPYQPIRSTVAEVERETAPLAENCGELSERPQLSGDMYTRETSNFVVHYTDSGVDAATEEFMDEVQAVLDDILTIQINQLGWPAAPSDCGEGGDGRFDLYVQEILDRDGILGYAVPEGMVGDNPSTAKTEQWAAYSHLIIDNDFQGATSPLSVMRATVAHEIHHGIQFGYDLNDSLNWYYEATASWMETQTYPEEQDATGYVLDVFTYPDVCIGSTPDDPDYGTRIYGEWLLIDSLAQDFGPQSILQLWELIGDEEGMDSLYTFLDQNGMSPTEMMARYATRNLLQQYALGYALPETVRVEGVVNGVGEVIPDFSGVEEMSVDYVLVRRDGVYTFTIDQPNLYLIGVGVDQNTNEAYVYDLGQSGTIDTTFFTYTYLIVINTDQHADPELCSDTFWTLFVEDGSGAEVNEPLDEYWDATYFEPAG